MPPGSAAEADSAGQHVPGERALRAICVTHGSTDTIKDIDNLRQLAIAASRQRFLDQVAEEQKANAKRANH